MDAPETKAVEQKPEAEPVTPPEPIPAEPMADLLEKEFGIQRSQINAWKAKHGVIEAVILDGKPYIYRGINRMEWKLMQRSLLGQPVAELEDVVTDATLLYPAPFDKAERNSAGVPSVIYAAVTRLSKFEPEIPPQRL